MIKITASTRKCKHGFKPVVTAADHSAISFIGKPMIQRWTGSVEFVSKLDALEYAQFVADDVRTTNSMP